MGYEIESSSDVNHEIESSSVVNHESESPSDVDDESESEEEIALEDVKNEVEVLKGRRKLPFMILKIRSNILNILKVTVHPHDTTYNVKRMICKEIGVPAYAQKLFFAGI